MPGIFGLSSATPTLNLAGRLSAASESLHHHRWYAGDAWSDPAGRAGLGRVTTGCVNAAAQPIRNEDGSLIAVMEGEVYDYAVRRAALEAAGHRFASDSHAELIVHGFEDSGPKFLDCLNGKFVIAIWDTRTRQLHLANDRFGMKPLYFAHRVGRLTFGSEIKAVFAVDASIPRRTNIRGVSQFFTFGHLLGDDTLFDGIHLLPAATCLTYDAAGDKLTSVKYWRLAGRTVRETSTNGFIDRVDATFAASVRRMTSGTKGLGLSLSGGLDARTILGVLDAGTSVTSLSLGMAGSLDHRCAAELARLADSPHKQVFLGEEFLSDFETHLRRMVWLTDGQYLCQCIVMPTLPIYREMDVRVLLRGHAGELMHMTKAYNFSLDPAALRIKDETGLFTWLWRHLQSYMLDGTGGHLFATRFRADVDAMARESLAQALRQTAGIEPFTHRIWQLFLDQRSRRETALSLAEFESVVETRLPYLDHDLIEALFAAPPALKLDDTLQTQILKRRRPSFLFVPNANTGARMGAGPATRFTARVRHKVLAKLGVPGYQPYERLGLWLRRELRPLVQKLLLADRCLGRGVFEPQTVRRVVNDHLDNRANHTFLILALMVFEVAQQEFMDGDQTPTATRAVSESVCEVA